MSNMTLDEALSILEWTANRNHLACVKHGVAQLRSDLAASRERCEKLEWLVEVLNFWFTFSEPWGPRKAYYNVAYQELARIRKAALAAVEGE